MKNIVVIAPHPDDETLGCGGTLFRLRAEGKRIHWIRVTQMSPRSGYSVSSISRREKEIKAIEKFYRFNSSWDLGFSPCSLDQIPKSDLIFKLKKVINEIKPDTLFVPFPGDAHSDHRAAFDAVLTAAKWFRAPSVKNIYTYETLSETGFKLDPTQKSFVPNLYINITSFLQKKINAMKTYQSEWGKHPFPRSADTMKALALLRGSECGVKAAEAFMILRETR